MSAPVTPAPRAAGTSRSRRRGARALGVAARPWRCLRALCARVTAALGAALVLAVVRAGPAAAAGASTAMATLGQTPPSLAWIDLADSRGVAVWSYELSINRGGITSPGAFVWSVGADTCWQFYRSTVVVALWFLDWVLAFSWVPVIAAPLLAVGNAMSSVVARLGVVPTLLAVAAAIAVVWMVRGRWATGIWELAMTCVIASLALGVFASPVALVAGPDGAIMGTQRAALELSAQISPARGGQDAGGDAASLRAAQSGAMVETFIRQPTQLVNFGQVIDGGPCQGAYDEAIASGPHGYDDTIAKAVGGCDKAAGDYADAPSASMVGGTLILVPAALAILGVAVLLAGSVIAAGISAMYASVKAVVTLVTGLLPGGARTSFFLTMTSAVVSLAILGLTTIFLSVFLLVIQALFASTADQAIPKTFLIVDIVLVVGALVYWRQRRHLASSAERMARWMSWRPGGAPKVAAAPQGGGNHLGAAAAAAGLLAQLRAARTASALASGAGAGAGAVASATDARQLIVVGAWPPPGAGPTSGPGPRPPRPHPGRPAPLPAPAALGAPPPAPGPAGRPRGGAGRTVAAAGAAGLVSLGASAALGAATAGSSTALSAAAAAARAASAARRAALSTRLSGAATPAPAPGGPLFAARPAAPAPPPVAVGTAPPGPSAPVVPGQVITSRRAPTTPTPTVPARHGQRAATPPLTAATPAPAQPPRHHGAPAASAQAWAGAGADGQGQAGAVAAASAGGAHAHAVAAARAAAVAGARAGRARRR